MSLLGPGLHYVLFTMPLSAANAVMVVFCLPYSCSCLLCLTEQKLNQRESSLQLIALQWLQDVVVPFRERYRVINMNIVCLLYSSLAAIAFALNRCAFIL